MQQLNSLYRGDSSETLGQIMGGQYTPLNTLNSFTSNLAMTGIQGVGATNRTAMQLASQENIERRRLMENKRQFGLTNDLAQRQQYEAELNGLATRGYNAGMLANTTRTTDFNTGGNIDIADNEAHQQGQTMLTMIDTQIQSLDQSDPNYEAQVAALQQRRQSIANQLAAGKKAGRGGSSGVMKVLTPEIMRPFGKDGKPVAGGVADWVSGIVDRSNGRAKAPVAPAPVAARPAAAPGSYISPNHVTTFTSANGTQNISLPEGVNVNDLNLFNKPVAKDPVLGTPITAPNGSLKTFSGIPVDFGANTLDLSTPYDPLAPGDPGYYEDEAATPGFIRSQMPPEPTPKRKLKGLS